MALLVWSGPVERVRVDELIGGEVRVSFVIPKSKESDFLEAVRAAELSDDVFRAEYAKKHGISEGTPVSVE